LNQEHYLDLQLRKLVKRKIRGILSNFVMDSLTHVKIRKSNGRIRRYKKSSSGQILVLASGPSLSDSIQKWNKIKKNRESFVMGINNQILYEEELGIRFTHYVLADPFYFEDFDYQSAQKQAGYSERYTQEEYEKERAECLKVLSILSSRKIECYVPYWAEEFCSKMKLNEFRIFCDRARASSNNLTDPSRTLGIRPLTGYMGIAIANYIGFESIYIAGFDNNTWKTLSRNPTSRRLEYTYSHFFSEPTSLTQRELEFDTTSELLGSAASIHRIHEAMKEEIQFINLDDSSLSA
jgi:hypothetical protein